LLLKISDVETLELFLEVHKVFLSMLTLILELTRDLLLSFDALLLKSIHLFDKLLRLFELWLLADLLCIEVVKCLFDDIKVKFSLVLVFSDSLRRFLNF